MIQENYATTFLGKTVDVTIDRPIDSQHPKYNFTYKLNYGFVPNTLAPDGEEVDAYIMGVSEEITNFKGKCIAVIHRTNDDDDKLIVTSGENYSDEEIKQAVFFQEKYFEFSIIRI